MLNSDWHDYLGRGRTEDRLENLDWLQRFLARWGISRTVVSRPDTRGALKDLRTLISGMVDRMLAGKEVHRRDWDRLNQVLSSTRVLRRLEKGDECWEIRLISPEGLIDSALADIAASFAQVFTEGDPSRIKLCENPDCCWVIYDHSKSRTRRWCEGSTGCGNLMKVRRHRAKAKKRGS